MSTAEVIVRHAYPEPARMPATPHVQRPPATHLIDSVTNQLAHEYLDQLRAHEGAAVCSAVYQAMHEIPTVHYTTPDYAIAEFLNDATFDEEIKPDLDQWVDVYWKLTGYALKSTMLHLHREMQRHEHVDTTRSDPVILVTARSYQHTHEIWNGETSIDIDLVRRAPSIITRYSQAWSLLQTMASEYRSLERGEHDDVVITMNALERGSGIQITSADVDLVTPTQDAAAAEMLLRDASPVAFYYYLAERACIDDAIDHLSKAKADAHPGDRSKTIIVPGGYAEVDAPIRLDTNRCATLPIPIETSDIELRVHELDTAIERFLVEQESAAWKVHLAETGNTDQLPRLIATRTSTGELLFSEEQQQQLTA